MIERWLTSAGEVDEALRTELVRCWRVVGTWPGALRVGEHDVRDEVLMVLDLT